MSEQQFHQTGGRAAEPLQSSNHEQDLASNPLPAEVTRRLYVIESGGAHFALDDAFSCGEVLSEPSIYKLPGCAPSLLGVCYRRGDIVPIYDLALLLGGEETDKSNAQPRTEIQDHHKVHYLPVNRKMHRTYVVIMGGGDDTLAILSRASEMGNDRLSGRIGFSLSTPPTSLSITEDDIVNASSDSHPIKGVMSKFIKSTTRYAKMDRPVIHLDWLGYCVAQVKALAEG